MDPTFQRITLLSILILMIFPLHVISSHPPPPQARLSHQKPMPMKPSGRAKSPPALKEQLHHQRKALPPPMSPHKHQPVVPTPHSLGKGHVKATPQAEFKPGKSPPKSKANVGKKIGVLFLGIAAALQVAIVGFLGFKMWQISKIKHEEFAF